MVASNNRDVRLGIEIQTAGEDSIKRLASEVRKLAQEGDPAASEYRRLGNELDRLSEQAGAIQAVKALTADVAGLTVAERAAADAAERATVAFREQAAAASTLREQQAAARAEVAQAKTAYDDLKLAYQTLKNEGRAAAESQAAFNSRLREARQQVDEQNRALKARRDTLLELNREVTAAERVERSLSRAFEQTTGAAQSTGGALRAQSSALEQLQEAARALGVDVGDLAAAENRLLEASRAYIAEVGAKRKQVSLEQAEADRLAAIEARGLAEAQRQGAAAAASELAAIRDSEQFLKQYAAATAAAARNTLALAQAEERRVARLREQSAADREAYQVLDGLADARDRARVAAESELAAIRDSELFIKAETDAKRAALAATLALAEADEKASVAAREFAASEAAAAAQFSRLADEAARVRLFTAELDRLDAAAAAAAAESKRLADAGEAVTRAFGQTGVRSLQAIRAEMTGVGQSLGLLQRQFRSGAIGADDLTRATSSAQVRLATLRRELELIPALPNAFEKINSSVNDLISRFGSLTAAVATVGFVVKPVLDAGIAFETLRRTLNDITGSAEQTADLIVFLRETSDRAGISVGQLANSFSLFASSLSKSGVSLQDTKTLFEGVAGAAGQFGLSTDKVTRILTALGQIANKGKVSLEELQGQVGEALPGALKLAADSLGLTIVQLQALLKEGSLLSDDFLPLFGEQLKKTFGEGKEPVEGLAQAFNRLKTAATTASQRLVDTTAYRALSSTLDALAANFDTILGGLGSLTKGFIAFKAINAAKEFFGIKVAVDAAILSKAKDATATAAQAAATRAATVATDLETKSLVANTLARNANTVGKAAGTAATALGALQTGAGKVAAGFAAARTSLGGFVTALGGPYVAAATAAFAFSDQLGRGIAFVAAKASGAIDSLDRNEKALLKLAEAEKIAAAEAEKAANAKRRAFIQTQQVFERQKENADEEIKVSERLRKAKSEEGDALVALAELANDEALAKAAATRAANDNLGAIRGEIAARVAEVRVLEEERAALALVAGAQSTWNAERRKFFEELDQGLARKRADLEITVQQARVQQQAAAAAGLAAEKDRDNAGRLEELRVAADSAAVELQALKELFDQGLISLDQFTAGQQRAASSAGLLKDAYDDSAAALRRQSEAVREAAGLADLEAQAQRRKVEVDLEIAEATGQYTDRLAAQVALKRLDIQETQRGITAGQQEAALLRQEANLAQQALVIGDAQFAQKQRQIDALRNSARAIELEGQAQQESLRGLETQLGLLDGSLFQTARGIDGLSTAMRNLRADTDAATEAQKRFADSQELGAQATEAANSPLGQLRTKQREGALGGADLPAAQQNLDAAQFNLTTAQGNLSRYSFDGFASIVKAYEEARTLLQQTQAAAFVEAANTSIAQQPQPATTTQRIEISLDGTRTVVNTATPADGNTLVGLLQSLSDASKRAGR